MIKRKMFQNKQTDENGSLELELDFSGYLVEIDIDFGELEQDSKVTFATSNGRTFEYTGNNPNDFPFSPRHSINNARFAHMTQANNPLEKYVNAGTYSVKFENAGKEKTLGYVVLVYEI